MAEVLLMLSTELPNLWEDTNLRGTPFLLLH